jgi:hypothetical protein
MADGKVTRAELAGAVRELREEVARLRAERELRHCYGVHCNWGHCGCFTWHGYSGTVTYPHTFTVTSIGGNVPGVNPYLTTAGSPVSGYEMSGGTAVSSGYTVSGAN